MTKDTYEIEYIPEIESISIDNTYGDYLRVYIEDIPWLINKLQSEQKGINKMQISTGLLFIAVVLVPILLYLGGLI